MVLIPLAARTILQFWTIQSSCWSGDTVSAKVPAAQMLSVHMGCFACDGHTLYHIEEATGVEEPDLSVPVLQAFEEILDMGPALTQRSFGPF